MNRYLPSLLSLLLSLPLAARAAESNRVADGGSEPASNWLKVKFIDGSRLQHEYWCHASDCDALRYQGPSKNVNRSKIVATEGFSASYMKDVPLYTLWPAKDPLVSLPTFSAVREPEVIEELDFADDSQAPGRAYFDLQGEDGKRVIGTFDLKAKLADGKIVVLAREFADTGKPMDLGTTELNDECRPGAYGSYYGENSGEARLLNKAFSPMEFQLERANLGINSVVARVHSGNLNGRDFASIAREANTGNLRLADDFVGAMRPQIRSAAQLYRTGSASYPADLLDPFEQRFLLCLMGFAGKKDDFRVKVGAAQENPGAFVASWRKFMQLELGRYADSKPPAQFSSKEAFDQLDWKAAWDGLDADAVAWLEKGALPASSSQAPAAPPQPQVVRKAVDPAAPARQSTVHVPTPDELNQRLQHGLGGGGQ